MRRDEGLVWDHHVGAIKYNIEERDEVMRQLRGKTKPTIFPSREKRRYSQILPYVPVAAVCVVWTPANRGARAALEEGDGEKALVLQVIIKFRIHTPPDSHRDADPD